MRYFSKYLLFVATILSALFYAGMANAQTIEFGSGDRSGKAWGQGAVRTSYIQVNSTRSVPGFATQENVNAFIGADLSEPLRLRLTVLSTNTNPQVQILIKTPGNSAKYYADISGLSGTVTVTTDTPLGSPEGSLGDLSAVEYIEVKGAWNSNTVRTNIRVRELQATPAPVGGDLATIEFGSGDRSGKAWGQGAVRTSYIQVNSTRSVPGFATQENVNAFAGADLSEPLQLRLTVLSTNTNPRVQILIKTPGHSAKYFADIAGQSGTVTVETDQLIGSPAGSLGDLSAVEYIEVKGAWNSGTVRTSIRVRELTATIGSGGGGVDMGDTEIRNSFNRVLDDGLRLDFEYMKDVRSEALPFEWRVTGGGANNRYYGLTSESDGIQNDNKLTTILPGVNSSSVTTVNGTPIKFRTNSHRVNGAGTDRLGDFRIKCQWSHFAYDDPIVFSSTDENDPRAPGPNKSHLHMFWGNTAVNWATDLTNKNSNDHIAARGGSSCNGGALNRSSYWMPALMHNDDHVMTPKEILVYYKTWESPARNQEVAHVPADTNRMPQGLQLIAGNGNVPDGSFTPREADNLRNLNLRNRDFSLNRTSENIYWACGNSDGTNVKFNRIPTYAEWKVNCQDDWFLNATIYFPQCMQNQHEIRSGFPHRHHVSDTVAPDRGCPAGNYEHRIPRLGYLLYWDVKRMISAQDSNPNTQFSIDNLRLSSDPTTYVNQDGVVDVHLDTTTGLNKYRGGTLHADWVAAWHDKVMDMWIDHCSKDAANCSVGQLGTGISLRDRPRDYGGRFGFQADGQTTNNSPANYMHEAPHGSSIASMDGM